MAARIRKGDKVEVIAGAEKGKRGEVVRVLPKENRAVVSGVAMATRHMKPRSMSQPGGLIQKERSVHLSNLMPIDPKTDKVTRVGYRVESDGRKVRISRRSGVAIDG